MSIRLSVWRKCLFVSILIIAGMCLAARSVFTEAAPQDPVDGALQTDLAEKQAPELEYSGIMISRAHLLNLEDNSKECSESKISDVLNLSQVQIRRIKVVLTGYSSTVAQTDSTPFITASGAYVRDGIVANNGLPFGTELRIPELFGDKIFSVQDRMHSRKGSYHVDIWFPTYEQAKNFGVRYAYVEVIEN